MGREPVKLPRTKETTCMILICTDLPVSKRRDATRDAAGATGGADLGSS